MKEKPTQKEEPQTTRLSRLIAAYALLPNAASASRQLSELTRTIPFFLFFHLAAAVSVNVMVFSEVPQLLLGLWQSVILLTAGVFIWAIQQGHKTGFVGENAESILKVSPIIGVILAFAWVSPTLVFSHYANFDQSLGLFWISFAIMATGAISLVRLPAAAIIFSALMTIAIAYGASVTLHVATAMASIVGAFFVLAVVGAIVTQHYTFLKQIEAEEKIKHQSEVIKLLLNDFESGSSDWIWETNYDGKLVYFSPRLAAIFNKKIGDLLGLQFSTLFETEPNNPTFSPLETQMANRDIVSDQIYRTEIDGLTQHWQISAHPLATERNEFSGYRGVGRDITKQIKHDQEIRKAKEEAERANASKSQFLAVISHELRTPINAIIGFSEVLNSEHNETLPIASQHEYLSTILESARHLQGLINDILDATRIERGSLQMADQEIDAAELVETAVRICRSHATKNKITLIAHLVDDVLIIGDLTRLKQVILNLITNAIKFSPADGIVNIDMQRGPQSSLLISIRDAGIGIKPEDVERIFEPFAQGDEGLTRQYGGMGLGLAIARKIARLHGGEVTLNGAEGMGTEATITMPKARVRWPAALKKSEASVAA
jgi:signal transduction histidine kinase